MKFHALRGGKKNPNSSYELRAGKKDRTPGKGKHRESREEGARKKKTRGPGRKTFMLCTLISIILLRQKEKEERKEKGGYRSEEQRPPGGGGT